jgi:hypothetical protein
MARRGQRRRERGERGGIGRERDGAYERAAGLRGKKANQADQTTDGPSASLLMASFFLFLNFTTTFLTALYTHLFNAQSPGASSSSLLSFALIRPQVLDAGLCRACGAVLYSPLVSGASRKPPAPNPRTWILPKPWLCSQRPQ